MLLIDCGLNTTAVPSAATSGSSGGMGDGALCIPNGDAAIEFLGFKEVSEL